MFYQSAKWAVDMVRYKNGIKINIYILTLILFSLVSCESGWEPPENPNPKQIFEEARIDFKEQRYEEALAKHVWYHKKALNYRRSLAGVRLSFALQDWYKLGQVYPPALSKLKEIRAEARKKILAGENIHELFIDFSAINRTLAEDSLTSQLFIVLEAKNPMLAKEIFRSAQPALIKAKEYAKYGKYIDPEMQLLSMIHRFQENIERAEDPKYGDSFKEYTVMRFTNEAATMISILVLTNRLAEAEKIAFDVKKEYQDETFYSFVDSALQGIVPEPWP